MPTVPCRVRAFQMLHVRQYNAPSEPGLPGSVRISHTILMVNLALPRHSSAFLLPLSLILSSVRIGVIYDLVSIKAGLFQFN